MTKSDQSLAVINDNKALLSGVKKENFFKIFIIGMPGAGKSFWAEKLKKQLKLVAYDLDTLVEVMDERSIPEIFAENGEEYFRKAEVKMLKLFGEKKQFILATGGGTPCYDNNMQWMNKTGITIWINEPIATLYQRLMTEKEQRPLIQHLSDRELEIYLHKKLEERQPFYEMATYKISGDNITESNFVEIIKKNA